MISLDDMMVFVSVAEAGSFTKAAEQLGLSKARVSQIVSQLENQLNTRLLQRTTRALTLSDAGQLYLEKCKQIQAISTEANQQAQSSTQQLSGTIRVAAPIGSEGLIAALSEFMAQHPTITLQLIESDAYSDFIDERVDIAIRTNPHALPDSSLYAAPLGTFKVILCCSPRYLAQAPTLNTLNDLEQWDWVCHGVVEKNKQQKVTDKQGHTHLLNLNARLISNTALSIKNFLLNHIGFSFLPRFMVQKELQQGALVQLLPQQYEAELPYYAVYDERTLMPVRVKALLEFLKVRNVYG